jgi:5'-phosphate synthase pdxT subunit
VTLRVGVLALQGDFREHAAVLDRLGVEAVLIKNAGHLNDLDGLILPGGESTTIGKLAERYELMQPLRDLIDDGTPTLGTCAGLILLADSIAGDGQPLIGSLDVVVARNAYGSQVDSFEVDIEVDGIDGQIRAVFIRAPRIEKAGEGVETLASFDGHPVVVRQERILATSFHPELTGDGRLHTLLLDQAGER